MSWQKRTSPPGFPERGRRDAPAKTYWTLEAPLGWKKPDDLFVDPNLNAMDLYLQVRMWVAPRG